MANESTNKELKKLTPDGLRKIFSLVKDFVDDSQGIAWEDTSDTTDYPDVW